MSNYCGNRNVDYVEKVQRMGEDRGIQHKNALRDFEYTPISFEDGIIGGSTVNYG